MKIAFLFLLISDIYHEKSWVNFFKGHEAQYSVHLHSKFPLKSAHFKQYELSKKMPSTWANTMNAQVELLREALKDEKNSKFVFISESTIPLQPFETVYEMLMSHPHSQFNFYKEPSQSRYFPPIPHEKIYKNSQWVVLNRKHAELMATDELCLPIMAKFPHDQEHYPSTLLMSLNETKDIIKKDTTFVYWAKRRTRHPYSFSNLVNDRNFEKLITAINKKMLFARKFTKQCDLTPLKPYVPFLE